MHEVQKAGRDKGRKRNRDEGRKKSTAGCVSCMRHKSVQNTREKITRHIRVSEKKLEK